MKHLIIRCNRRSSYSGENSLKRAYAEEKAVYQIRVEKALILVLVGMILMFVFSRRIYRGQSKERQGFGYSITALDLVPATSQGSFPRSPTFPKIPVPSEDEFLPEDETIDLTRLDLNEGKLIFGEGGGWGGGDGTGGIGPRPIGDVIPEYPEDELRRGVEGIVELEILVHHSGYVDSVRVLRNTTRSEKLKLAAVEAASQSRYMPARKKGQKISRWIRRYYRFEKK